ncbi:hypothetical protein QBC37DRAFT_406751 [Rhypophila decipiens]|uniref:Uncharacterized protein n=1 Tax=Rhypophila decipiens TaxID=261697 RepID=A0AAN7B1I6_9PEZI|nr:hypothetical protein QBC37DRAFT_406751 [Rhypophila decipiens]
MTETRAHFNLDWEGHGILWGNITPPPGRGADNPILLSSGESSRERKPGADQKRSKASASTNQDSSPDDFVPISTASKFSPSFYVEFPDWLTPTPRARQAPPPTRVPQVPAEYRRQHLSGRTEIVLPDNLGIIERAPRQRAQARATPAQPVLKSESADDSFAAASPWVRADGALNFERTAREGIPTWPIEALGYNEVPSTLPD